MRYVFSRLLFRCKRIRRRWQPIKYVCTDPSLGSLALPMPIVPQICSFIASAMSLRSPNKVEHIGGSCMSGWKHVRQANGILPVVSLRVFCNGQIGEVQKKWKVNTAGWRKWEQGACNRMENLRSYYRSTGETNSNCETNPFAKNCSFCISLFSP